MDGPCYSFGTSKSRRRQHELSLFVIAVRKLIAISGFTFLGRSGLVVRMPLHRSQCLSDDFSYVLIAAEQDAAG